MELHEVTVHYGDVLALDRVSLHLPPGRVCALVGMNGSGKSTLFKTVMGLVPPDSGVVRIHGREPAAARRDATVGYVPQAEDVDWDFPLTVRDVVLTGRYRSMGFTRRPGARDRAAVDEALERVELTAYADRQIGRLSGGQKKRAFVARGLAQGATTLLLDEPFAGVDVRSQATITEVLRELAAAGATVLVSTHDLASIPALADDAALLMRRILAHGDPADVLRPEQLARAFGAPSAPVPPAFAAPPEPAPEANR